MLFRSGVRSTTVRIIPSRPSISCSMRALFHMWRGRTSSCSSPTSPPLNLVDACCYRTSWKLLNVVRYSLCHRLQKSSASFSRILNSFVMLPFVLGSVPDGTVVSLFQSTKCAGVNAPDSSSACTMGLDLKAASIATRVVFSPSSEAWNRPSTLRRQYFVVRKFLHIHIRLELPTSSV